MERSSLELPYNLNYARPSKCGLGAVLCAVTHQACPKRFTGLCEAHNLFF